jgi:uncharacterized protein YjbI with pentapeptide repeats
MEAAEGGPPESCSGRCPPARLTDSDLGGANLSNTNVSGVAFRRVKLMDANLVGANLRGLAYDRATRWPAGFNPRLAGAKLEE